MKKIAYLECPTGIAGDMCLGALVHAGVPLDYLRLQLAKLGISHEYHLRAEQIYHNGQLATKVHVDLLLDETLDHGHTKNISVSQSTDRSCGFHNRLEDVLGDGSLDRSCGFHNRPSTSPSKPDLHLLDIHDHSHDHEHNPSHQNQQDDHLPSSHHNHEHHHHGQQSRHRHLPEITQLITQADLPTKARDWSLAVFQSLAAAESAVHGVPADQVHFHEVGATDAIVDIVGTCLGLDWLGIEELYCSALPTGGGTVWADHGRLPVPVPAVLQLWQSRRCPIYSNGIEKELVTPTGAALAVTLVQDFGAPPAMNLHTIGLGAGSQQLPIPNILRLWIGERQAINGEHQHQVLAKLSHHPIPQSEQILDSTVANLNNSWQSPQIPLETIAVLETQIDDLSPQAISYACDRLFQVGALDVFTQGITMKKSRLGTLLTVITPVAKVSECEAVLFQETSTLGIRRSIQERSILQREIRPVQTAYGAVRVKIAWQQEGNITNVQPEYEDCAAIARATNLPWRQIHAAALQKGQEIRV